MPHIVASTENVRSTHDAGHCFVRRLRLEAWILMRTAVKLIDVMRAPTMKNGLSVVAPISEM